MFLKRLPCLSVFCRHSFWRHIFAGSLAALLSACTHAPQVRGDTGRLARELPRYSYSLLGEVHDNGQGHALREHVLADAVAAGWRPIIAMEQFDREYQGSLDDALRTCTDAPCVIAAASPGPARWNWLYYRPIIELALRHRLPLLAANLSRADAGRVMKSGLTAVFTPAELKALGLEKGPDANLLQEQISEVVDGHCGMLPSTLHAGMATAQIARDAMMALLMRRAARSEGVAAPVPVVLLAGNGHVRRDKGVPRWLNESPTLAVGFTETVALSDTFDRNIVVSAVPRPDPCASLQESFKK